MSGNEGGLVYAVTVQLIACIKSSLCYQGRVTGSLLDMRKLAHNLFVTSLPPLYAAICSMIITEHSK